MASSLTPYLRRFKYLPIQVFLVLLVIIGYLLYRSHLSRTEEKSWREERLEELVKMYKDAEIDIQYLRHAGVVDKKIESLTEKELLSMNITTLMVTVHSFLDNTDIMCRRQVRMGYVDEGGWEICDEEGVRPRNPPCLVYSFGGGSIAEDEFSFEDDISRVYGCEVHSFKENFEGEDYNRTENILVHPFSIGRVSEITAEGKELYTFEDILTILDHADSTIDVLKLDIHGGEWPIIHSMLLNGELDNVKQLLVECHVGYPPEEDRLRREIRIFQELSEAGFRKFNVLKHSKGAFHHPSFPVAVGRFYEVHYLNTRFLRSQKQDRTSRSSSKSKSKN